MSLLKDIKITCKKCSTNLSVPGDYSGDIICAKCRNVMKVDGSTAMQPTTQTISRESIGDIDKIEQRLQSIDESIRGVSTAIWMVFLIIPVILVVIFLISD